MDSGEGGAAGEEGEAVGEGNRINGNKTITASDMDAKENIVARLKQRMEDEGIKLRV